MLFLLPLLLLITAGRCEVLQLPDEQVSMASLVCLTAEKQKKQEVVIDEVFKWLQKNLDILAKLSRLASPQTQFDAEKHENATNIETSGKSFQEFFANLTKSYILAREEIKCPFRDDNQTCIDLRIQSANLQKTAEEQQRRIRQLEVQVYRLSMLGVLSDNDQDHNFNLDTPSVTAELNEVKEQVETFKNECRSRLDKLEAQLEACELKAHNALNLANEATAELKQNLTQFNEAVETLGNSTESTKSELSLVQQDLAALVNVTQSQYAGQLQKWTNVVAIKERADKEIGDLRDKIKVLVGKQEHDKENSHNLRIKVEESLHELDRKFNNKTKMCENDIKVLLLKLDETKVSLERALRKQEVEQEEKLEKVNSEVTANSFQIEILKANFSISLQTVGKQIKKTEILVTKQSEKIQNGFCPTQLNGDHGDGCLILGPNKNCHCFITSTQVTWKEADQLCRWHGMRLVSIETEEENEAIFDIISRSRDGFWTSGIRQNRYSDTWIWASTGEKFTYTKWKRGEPNGGGQENCLELWFNFGAWNDKACSTKHSVICEA